MTTLRTSAWAAVLLVVAMAVVCTMAVDSSPTDEACVYGHHTDRIKVAVGAKSADFALTATVDDLLEWVGGDAAGAAPSLMTSEFIAILGRTPLRFALQPGRRLVVDGKTFVVRHDKNTKFVYPLVSKVVNETSKIVIKGFKEYGFEPATGSQWDVLWTFGYPYSKPQLQADFEKMSETQNRRVNHMPGIGNLARKDTFWKHISKFQAKHGLDEFYFYPTVYLLPNDYSKWLAAYEAHPDYYWVYKKRDHRGVRIITDKSEVAENDGGLVQQYIHRPLLIDGYKWDVRVYVVVTSLDPLRIYAFDDGILRFCKAKFALDAESLKDTDKHIVTHWGKKWSTKELAEWFRQQGHDWDGTWERIVDVIRKSFVATESAMRATIKRKGKHPRAFFELLGFDVLIDEDLNPYVLEVNLNPDMHLGQEKRNTDLRVKTPIWRDAMQLVGAIPPLVPSASRFATLEEQVRALGLTTPVCPREMWEAQDARDTRELKVAGLTCLTGNDISILQDTEDEYQARGNYLRLFPTRDFSTYEPMFVGSYRQNMLVYLWLEAKGRTYAPARAGLLSDGGSGLGAFGASEGGTSPSLVFFLLLLSVGAIYAFVQRSRIFGGKAGRAMV